MCGLNLIKRCRRKGGIGFCKKWIHVISV
jgi:hypothetical protein